MNDVKSVPFDHIPTVKNFHVHPPNNQKHIILANNAKFANHFPIRTIGKWNSQNLQQIAQNLLNSPVLVLNHVKFTPSVLIFQDSLSPLAKLLTFATFTHLCIFADFVRFALIGKQPRLERIQRNPP